MNLAIVGFTFTSCSDDDDGGGSSCQDLLSNYEAAFEAYFADQSNR
ncbi:hypothetical protein [Psychroflexus aestuariivivens]|nr:hypothetical protein [Psychroflexus aestuariivivens]